MHYRKVNLFGLLFLAVLILPAQAQNLVQHPDRNAVDDAARSHIFIFDPARVGPGQAPGLARGLAAGYGGQVRHVFTHTIRGFSANIPAQAAARLAAENPNIQYFEPNGVVWTGGPVRPSKKPTTPPGQGGSGDSGTTEPPQVIPWGISRVGGSVNVENNDFHAWIIDTGIDLRHPDLVVGPGANFVLKGKDSPADGNGHGTHVAGTIAAKDNAIDVVGIAAGAVVHPIRVLGNSGSGTVDDVVAGVDYVAANARPGDCANMSLSASAHFQSLHDAVVNAADQGIKFSLAAGNSAANASNYEPAHVNHANVYTVSAIDSQDGFASFSNWGNPPVDFAAPGVNVLSTKKGGGVEALSGTSMAAPHLCGILLLNTPIVDGVAQGDPDGNSDPIAHR